VVEKSQTESKTFDVIDVGHYFRWWWCCWHDVAGCEYGDRASWCPTFIASGRDCYSEGDTCCQTCQSHRVNIPGTRSPLL